FPVEHREYRVQTPTAAGLDVPRHDLHRHDAATRCGAAAGSAPVPASPFGRTTHHSRPTQSVVRIAAPSMSVGWCMPRYIRDTATAAGMIRARATNNHRHQCVTRLITMTAMAAQMHIVAAMWPDGNDDV